MRVISRARLRQFWQSPAGNPAEGPLRAWYTHVSNRSVSWQSWADIRAAFGTASLVGSCVVFNISGRKFRLITRVLFPSQKVFVLKVMDHFEYDEDHWKEECGCYTSPPSKAAGIRKGR